MRVARTHALEDDSDDPFERNFLDNDETDEEDSGDEDGGIERLSGSEEELDDSPSLEDDEDETVVGHRDRDVDRAELRRLMAEQQKNVSATLSQAAQADAAKGRAVKAQRKAFDQLLNVRIRLQKTLVASNTIAAEPHEDLTIQSQAVANAETAAMSLWNSLNALRIELQHSRTGGKRKHTTFSIDDGASTLWSQMTTLEAQEKVHRQAVLDRWSSKARGATAVLAATRGRLNNDAAKQQTLTNVLNSQLLERDRLIKRTQMPRSCAPVQANAGIAESQSIYDDADFYGLLLKELLEQRNAEASTAALDFNLQPWQAAREAKTKKVVDTKASKGRKLRYTVHEKLQNFMAPEDRTTWGERQVDELFGSLFGRKIQLGDDDEMGEDQSDQEEEAGLMLFKT